MDEFLNNVLVGIPESVATLQLPDPVLRDYYLDEQDRTFWVTTQIDNNLLDLVKMIIKCNREDKDKPVEDRKPIKVFIDKYFNLLASLFTVMLIGFTALALWLFGSGEESTESIENTTTTEVIAPTGESTTNNDIENIEPCDTLR